METMTDISATFVGGPTVRFTYAGLAFLTDPTFDQPGSYGSGDIVLHKLAGPGITPDEVAPVDVVLLSHDQHPDNLDNSGKEFLAGVPMTLSTASAAARMPGITALSPWDQHDVGGVRVTAVPAQHGPVGCEPISGEVIGFVLEADGWPTAYVSGDNASVEVLASIVDRFPAIEVAFLFVGAANVGRFGDHNVTLGSVDAAAIAGLLGDAVVVPVHAQDWAHFTEPLSAFEAAYPGKLVVLPRGIEIDV
jgi:L-ascorbate metabolism protein UlaG (beta-lactamase superfamily)